MPVSRGSSRNGIQHQMCSRTGVDQDQSSRLLQLPREIRDLIYEYVLVRDVIPIECAVTNMPDFSVERSHWYGEAPNELFPLRQPCIHRRIWAVPAFDIDRAFVVTLTQDDSINRKTYHMTYQLAVPLRGLSSDAIEIRLLQACKQVYSEALKIFYGKNVFSFTADFRIPSAFAFLCDRPAASLLLISSLELALTEDNNMRNSTKSYYPLERKARDALVLQYAYNHFTDLCTLLSTSRMRLRKLYFTIDTLAERYDNAPRSVQECIAWESLNTTGSRPWITSWVEPLLKIHDIDFIGLCWVFDRPRMRRMADTVSLMRHHMLADKQTQTPEKSAKDVEFKFRVLHQGEAGDNNYVKYDPRANPLKWREYSLRDDGSWQKSKTDVVQKSHESIAERQHVRDALQTCEGVYICYCELNAV